MQISGSLFDYDISEIISNSSFTSLSAIRFYAVWGVHGFVNKLKIVTAIGKRPIYKSMRDCWGETHTLLDVDSTFNNERCSMDCNETVFQMPEYRNLPQNRQETTCSHHICYNHQLRGLASHWNSTDHNTAMNTRWKVIPRNQTESICVSCWMQHSYTPLIWKNIRNKVVHVFNYVSCHEEVQRSGGLAPHIINYGDRLRWVVNSTLRPLYPLLPIVKGIGRGSECHGEEKNLLSMPGI
jgi:hypothetical protein